MRPKGKSIIFLIAGLAIMAVAVFGQALALDHDTHWGTGRISLLVLGGLITGGTLLYPRMPSLPLVARMRANADLAYLARMARNYLFTLPIALLVLAVYLWFCAASLRGYRLPGIAGYYYDLQAQAFRSGMLSLPLKPSAQLLTLPNPYDPKERQTLTVETDAPLDLSLYKGEFYEYWGPVPALALNLVRPLYHGQFHDAISDLEMIFGFLSGIFLVEYLLVLLIWERFFRALPGWMLLVSIAAAGLVTPSLEMLTRTIPGSTVVVYQVAITGGQFFLMAGFLAAFLAVDRSSPSGWRLALAGTCWALAVGSRNILVAPVACFCVMIVWRLHRMRECEWRAVARDLLPLGLPLFCGAVGLSWYNWARFGSISETGVSYILAGPYYLREHLAEFFSPVYVLQNLYNYVLLPFQLQAQFPFVSAARGRMDNLVPFYRLPAAYFTNQVTGLLFATPFCLFALVPAVRWIAQRGGPGAGANQTDPQARQLWVWVIASLAGGCLATFSLLQLFLWAAMRYIEDFMPALILLSLLGFWQGFALLEARPMTGRVYAMIGTILAIGSIAIGMLLPIGGNARLFVTNPLMMEWLARFFPR